ncbi:MAG: RtcB family protein [SAR324 cluster bacterium]|nr:RtcB family protein [SAR324 cluster bacterium]
MPEILNLNARNRIVSWANSHDLHEEEQRMLFNMAQLPCVFKHIALMPDAHLGKGAMVGSVIATRDAIIPAAVGVDIGCGMMARKLDLKASALEGKLRDLRLSIEARIPVGFEENDRVDKEVENWNGWKRFKELHKGVQEKSKKSMKQLGSLGGGNHFIEICVEPDVSDSNVWVMLHSGSRHIGNALATCHINSAKYLNKLMEQKAPDPELSYFVQGTSEFHSYWNDLQWAQKYAFRNREVMMDRILGVLAKRLNEGHPLGIQMSVNCHHNYAELEHHFGEDVYVTRKGAVRAQANDFGIIPGSMGSKSYIVKGKGNEDSFCSCSHGAGRQMSRTRAQKQFSVHDLEYQTQGVECRKDQHVLDEIPGAYKDIDVVMNAQSDLVEVVACLKQVVCVKG